MSSHPSRNHQFKLAPSAQEADLFIVDSEDASAIAKWRDIDPDRSHPVVIIDPTARSTVERDPVLRRPLLASRLLAAMDQLATGLSKLNGSVSAPPNSGSSVAQTQEVQVSVPSLRTSAPIAPSTTAKSPSLQPQSAGSPSSPSADQKNASEQSKAVKRRVLVVDDSPTVQKQLELMLREKNIASVIVSSGEQALSEMADRHFDLVLLDVVLPGSDGYQVCKAIRKLRRGFSTPVVMLTSKSSPFDRLRGSLAGCDTYLVKPVELDKFLSVLTKYLKTDLEGSSPGRAAARAGFDDARLLNPR